MDGIILKLVGHVLGGSTSVDGLEISSRVINANTSDLTTDTSETIDTTGITHVKGSLWGNTAHGGEGCNCGKADKNNCKTKGELY